MTPEECAIKALAEVLPSREVTALVLEYQLDAAKHGTWRGRQQAQEAVAAAIWSRIDRDALRAALCPEHEEKSHGTERNCETCANQTHPQLLNRYRRTRHEDHPREPAH